MDWPVSNFPTSLDVITDKVDSVDDIIADDINGAYDCIEKMQAKMGVNSSAVDTSLDYKLCNASSSNPGHKHTLAQGCTDVTATAAEVNRLAGVTPGTVAASKVLIVDANKDISSLRKVTAEEFIGAFTGNVDGNVTGTCGSVEDGSINGDKLLPVTAGTVKALNKDLSSTLFTKSTSFVKKVQYKIARKGIVRVTQSISIADNEYGVQATSRIYVNGSYVTGTENVTPTAVHTDNITVSHDDTIEIWLKTGSSIYAASLYSFVVSCVDPYDGVLTTY